MTHRFQHPRVLCTEHRAITKLDWSIPRTPLHEVLGDLQELDGRGWTAITLIDGEVFRLRGGGKDAGPRSVALDGVPGVYARGEESGRVYELLAKAEAPRAVDLDSLDLIPFGRPVEDAVPGWDGWGDEPNTCETTCAPDPMEPQS